MSTLLRLTRQNLLAFFVVLSIMILVVVGFKTTKGVLASNGCKPVDFSGIPDPSQKIGFFEGKEVNVPEVALAEVSPVLGVSNEDRWIDVDLSEQKLRAWEGNNLYLETLVSTGLPWWPTPTGEFYIWSKFRATRMEGGSGRYYYNLPNVPFVMFFENASVPGSKGFSLHGTYWHHDFGKVHSHGCVNLPTSEAEKLFWWTSSRNDNGAKGTKIVIHE